MEKGGSDRFSQGAENTQEHAFSSLFCVCVLRAPRTRQQELLFAIFENVQNKTHTNLGDIKVIFGRKASNLKSILFFLSVADFISKNQKN